MPVKEIVSESKNKMDKAVQVLHDELKSIRTGRASTGLVENLKVDYYGTPTPLKQLAALATPQPDMVVIKPFDPGSLKQIESANKNSNLSIAPIVDGKLVRHNITALNEERRKQVQSQAKQTGEQSKVSIRNIRREANKQLEKEEKDNVITEDDLQLGKKRIDEVAKEYSDEIDLIIKHKAEEIMGD